MGGWYLKRGSTKVVLQDSGAVLMRYNTPSHKRVHHVLYAGVFFFFIAAATPVALATPSSIWYSGVRDEQRLTVSYGVFPFDMNGDGIGDFIFDHGQNTLGVTMLGDNLLLADITGWSIPFYEGTEISETPPSGMLWSDGYFSFYSRQQILGGEYATTGYWQGIDHGMFGVNFDIGGESHYGWVRLSTGIDDQYSSYILHDWAYETQPGIGITAGTVPEPSSAALLICGGFFLFGRFCSVKIGSLLRK
jgi:hypothetical protein